MNELLSGEAFAAFVQVIWIDLVLAGDNAMVIGLAASGLPAEQRNRAIIFGILGATVLRIAFSVAAVQLLQIVGLLLAGGVLLLWVCWKMWRDLRSPAHAEHLAVETLGSGELAAPPRAPQRKTFGQAARQIIVADISMSLDNVLAVAGAAREHPIILVFGLAISIVLMGAAASLIARILQRYHWLGYLGLAVVFFVALEMIYEGARDIWWPEPEVVEGAGAAPQTEPPAEGVAPLPP
jgi:YjbE family integral membrane protein